MLLKTMYIKNHVYYMMPLFLNNLYINRKKNDTSYSKILTEVTICVVFTFIIPFCII